MDRRFNPALESVLPPNRYSGPNGLWFSYPDEEPSYGVTEETDGLHSIWTLGPRDSTYKWLGAVRGFDNVEKRLVFANVPMLRHRLHQSGPGLVGFYVVDRRFALPPEQGGPLVPAFETSTLDYGPHEDVLVAYRGGDLVAAGGCALPSMLKVLDVPLEQLYEELASPEGGEIFMVNPRAR